MSLKEISATEEIMRIAINGQKHVDSLIGYYRDQIDKFNDERIKWAIDYENCKNNATNKHLIQKEIDHSKSKIRDLQAQLGRIKANLTEERQGYFKKMEENQQIKNRLQQNKKRLRQMMRICKPINVNKSKIKQKSSLSDASISSIKEGGNSKKTQLELELINLGRQHDQRKNHLQQIISALKSQLDELLSEHCSRGNQCGAQYKEALSKLSDVQSKIMTMTIEYFKLQMENYESERKLQEENEIIRLKNIATVQKLKMLQQTHSNEFKMVDTQVKKKNKEFKEKYDEQLRKKQEHLSILKQQHQRLNDIYLNKMKKLQSELRQVTEKYRSVEQKSRVQVSSLRNQIKILNNRLEQDGVRQMRQEIANDLSQESDTLSMSELQKINNQVRQLEKKIERK